MYRCLPFHILYLCMKYEVCSLRHFLVIALQQSVDGQTDGQTDGQSDYYRAPVSSMQGILLQLGWELTLTFDQKWIGFLLLSYIL